MWFLIKMLFPKLWFGFDGDPGDGGGDPNGQPSGDDPGNGGDPSGGGQAPTEIVIGENKVKLDDLRSNPALKNYFDAYDNRERWQSENTRRAQQLKSIERDAREFQRLKSDPRFQQAFNPQQQPANRYDAIKQNFIQKASQQFGGQFDPNFMGMLFDSMSELSGARAEEVVQPFQNQYLSSWEKQFIKEHPLVKTDTQEYEELSYLIGRGADPEKAYKAVYSEQILNAEIESRFKKRDEENALKLKRSRQPIGTSGKKSEAKGDDAFEEVWSDLSER